MKALGKWLELLQLLLGFCSACSSTNARLEAAAMLGEGLVLVTSGDISCLRQSGMGWRWSEWVAASRQGRAGPGWMKTKGEHEWRMSENVQNKQKVSEWL